MARFGALVLTALPSAWALASGVARQQSLEKAWSAELGPLDPVVGKPNVSPVKRVVNLLTKMKTELEAETDKESEMYDKMVCWCETNEKEKTQAIATAEATIAELQAEIEERAAGFGKVSAEIANLKKQIAEDTAALKTAVSLRENEQGEAMGEEKELVQAITNLKNAIAVLSRHQGESLAQMDAPLLSGLKVVLHDVAAKHEEMLARSDSHTAFIAIGSKNKKSNNDVSTSQALLKALEGAGAEAENALPLKFAEQILKRESKKSTSSFLQARTERQPMSAKSASYSTRSDSIYGILTQMLEEFEGELGTTQKDEALSAESGAEMQKAKAEQIKIGKEKLDEMEAAHSGNVKALSDAKENYELTRKQRSADIEFLRKLKLTCNDLDAQWEKRSQTRGAETLAVAETISILTEDDNREQLVTSTAQMSFLQVSEQASARALRSKVAQVLRKASQAPEFDAEDLLSAWRGRKGSSNALVGAASPRAQLSTLAVSVQLDSFTKVKEMMDKLVAELKKQQEEEVTFKAYCTKELNENEKATYDKNEEKEDLEAKTDQLEALLKKLAEEIAEAQTQTVQTETEIKSASENREKENAEFQTVVADQRAMQDILKKALARLADFYTKGKGKGGGVYLQQEPPVKFNSYKENAGASPVMSLLEQIINDSVTLEKEATATETTAQSDYEAMVKDSNALIADLAEMITSKTKNTAAAELEKSETESSHLSAVGELESLAAYEADLHGQCDFVLKNFDIRQKARLQEMEAIAAAKGILSGDLAAGSQ